jgi:hypothetical protein
MAGSASLALRVVGVVAAGAAIAAAAGCTSGGSSSAPPTAPASSAASSAAPSAPTSAPATVASSSPAVSSAPPATKSPRAVASPASSSPAAGGPAGCATRDLQAKAGVAQAAAGSLYQFIDFTNISNATCTMYGYPGVSLAAGSPVAQVGMAASRSTVAGPTVVTLAPGQTANALLRITQALNYPSATCSPAKTTYLQIYPPNQTTPIYLAYASTGCTSTSVNLLMIGVVQAGAGTNGQ